MISYSYKTSIISSTYTLFGPNRGILNDSGDLWKTRCCSPSWSSHIAAHIATTICKCLKSLNFFFHKWTYINPKTWSNSDVISMTWRSYIVFGRFQPTFDRRGKPSDYRELRVLVRWYVAHKPLQSFFPNDFNDLWNILKNRCLSTTDHDQISAI